MNSNIRNIYIYIFFFCFRRNCTRALFGLGPTTLAHFCPPALVGRGGPRDQSLKGQPERWESDGESGEERKGRGGREPPPSPPHLRAPAAKRAARG